MRKFVPVLAAAFLFVGLTLVARAADEVTKTGEGVCAKCSLKETKVCQNVITVKEGDKEVKYYFAANDVSKKYHGSSGICTGTVKTKVTGTVEEKDGKMVITATKIEKVED